MNKLFRGLLITAACSTMSSASTFDGLYAGISGGYTQRNQSLSINGDKQAKHINALNYGLIAGYGRVICTHNGTYLGGEVSLHHDTANADKRYYIKTQVTNGAHSGSELTPVKAKYERGIVLGFAPRLGIMLSDSYLTAPRKSRRACPRDE